MIRGKGVELNKISYALFCSKFLKEAHVKNIYKLKNNNFEFKYKQIRPFNFLLELISLVKNFKYFKYLFLLKVAKNEIILISVFNFWKLKLPPTFRLVYWSSKVSKFLTQTEKKNVRSFYKNICLRLKRKLYPIYKAWCLPTADAPK